MQRIIEYFISENTGAITILDFLKREGFSRHILSYMKNVPHQYFISFFDYTPNFMRCK